MVKYPKIGRHLDHASKKETCILDKTNVLSWMHPITNTFMLSKYNLIFLLLQQLAINVEPTIAPKPNKMCSPQV
jgi:hypothetical protein